MYILTKLLGKGTWVMKSEQKKMNKSRIRKRNVMSVLMSEVFELLAFIRSIVRFHIYILKGRAGLFILNFWTVGFYKVEKEILYKVYTERQSRSFPLCQWKYLTQLYWNIFYTSILIHYYRILKLHRWWNGHQYCFTALKHSREITILVCCKFFLDRGIWRIHTHTSLVVLGQHSRNPILRDGFPKAQGFVFSSCRFRFVLETIISSPIDDFQLSNGFHLRIFFLVISVSSHYSSSTSPGTWLFVFCCFGAALFQKKRGAVEIISFAEMWL